VVEKYVLKSTKNVHHRKRPDIKITEGVRVVLQKLEVPLVGGGWLRFNRRNSSEKSEKVFFFVFQLSVAQLKKTIQSRNDETIFFKSTVLKKWF
jgi:hypothetical protein